MFNIGRTKKSNSNSNKAVKRLALAGLLCLLSIQAASSADYGTNNNRPNNKAAVIEEPEFKYQQLKRYQELPDLPQYSGQADFVQGILYPSAKGGKSITYNLAARESKPMVVRWYQDALKLYRWEFDGEQSADGVRAHKGGNFVQIMVAPPTRLGYGADIIITYRTIGQ